MIESPEELRAMTSELTSSLWTLAAIAALFEAGLVPHLTEPHTPDELAGVGRALGARRVDRLLGVAVTAGFVVASDDGRYRLAPSALPFAEPPMHAVLAGDLRANLMQALALVEASRDPTGRAGWSHTDPALLQSQGDASSAIAEMMKRWLVPSLDGLAERLARPGARFLDVGVGVAGIAIGMCRLFPELAVVGVDISEPALALARDNVGAAGLSSRIELRCQPIDDLPDEATFDLAWLPSFFVASTSEACARIHAALRPGGYLVFGFSGTGEDHRRNAVSRLIDDLWGGDERTAKEVEAMLERGGFSSIRAVAGPAWAPGIITARRP
jgi:SAM-dependent methyltransferase